jgi:hypothetical protein
MSDPLATFAATILGALIAGLISWLLARQSSKETLRRDREGRREDKLAIAYQAFVKLKTIIDSLYQVPWALTQHGGFLKRL